MKLYLPLSKNILTIHTPLRYRTNERLARTQMYGAARLAENDGNNKNRVNNRIKHEQEIRNKTPNVI